MLDAGIRPRLVHPFWMVTRLYGHQGLLLELEGEHGPVCHAFQLVYGEDKLLAIQR